jgi:eukaryotic-like serine/threonine-protein kinase
VPTESPATAVRGDSPSDLSLSAIFDNPRLPSLPAVALQVVEKASHSDCDPEELIALLRQDSGLCVRVLKTVNSGLFGLSRPVSSLKQAVLLLRTKPLRSLVLSVALPAVQTGERDGLIVKYWQESVVGAVIARQLAVHLKHPDPEDDLVAGLLRDLGALVLREAFPDAYRSLWESASSRGLPSCEQEQETFSVDHAELGASLLEHWNLPSEIYLPVRFHHHPGGVVGAAGLIRERTWLLHLATRIAALEVSSADDISAILSLAQDRFSMDAAALTAFLDSIEPTIHEFASILNINIGNCPNFAAILIAGSEALVRLSVEASRAAPPAPPVGGSPTVYASSPLQTQMLQTKASLRPSATTQDTPRAGATLPDFNVHHLSTKDLAGGFRLNNYEVREIIGRGGMGVVLKAYDPLLARFVAIKMLTPERLVLSEARERFAREARTSASIQHENVVAIYAVSEVNGLPYIVMEYVAGKSLQQLLDQGGPLPIPDIIRFGRQIAAGLHAAHLRRVIHRDIKPANILVAQETGSVKITDFGLARVLDEPRLSQQGTLAGTPQFMAPEQFLGDNVDHRADLFSLGSILYNLCVGSPPFAGESIMVVMERICIGTPAPIHTRRSDVPKWLTEVITRLLAKAPAARFKSAAQVVEAIHRQAATGV